MHHTPISVNKRYGIIIFANKDQHASYHLYHFHGFRSPYHFLSSRPLIVAHIKGQSHNAHHEEED